MLSVIVPMLNEPEPEVILGRVHEALVDLPEPYEVIVVTGDREKKPFALPLFPHTRHAVTYGDSLERSILSGFSHARGVKVVVMDADGSHPPENIPQMAALLDEYELVVGSRFMDGSEFRTGLYRRLVTGLTCFLAWEAGSNLRDPMSGFFAVRREVVTRCRFKPIKWKTALEIEVRAHPTVKEIPIRFAERSVGKSNTSFRVGMRILWDLATEGWNF